MPLYKFQHKKLSTAEEWELVEEITRECGECDEADVVLNRIYIMLSEKWILPKADVDAVPVNLNWMCDLAADIATSQGNPQHYGFFLEKIKRHFSGSQRPAGKGVGE